MSGELTPKRHTEYDEVISIIERTRENAFQAVNREMISMYWEIGAYVSDKVKHSGWGESIVADLARFIQAERPDIKGFSASNIWRMRQFYETYRDSENLATTLRQITWSNNLLIMARAKTEETREFYLLLCSKNKYSKRELERQMMGDDICWKRCFQSYKKALATLRSAARLAASRELTDLEKQGVIRGFVFTLGLACDVMRDYLEGRGASDIVGRKAAVRQAFSEGLIDNEQAWMDMLKARNLVARSYDDEAAKNLSETITSKYYSHLNAFSRKMRGLEESDKAR